jgi:hypothetical protein
MTLRLLAASAVLLLTLAPAARAAKVKVWHHHSPAHYEKAQWKHAVISNEGALRLARQLKPLHGVAAAHVWDVIEDPHGNLFVATGDEGKLYKMTPDGKVSVAFESAESQILCLALAPDGAVYAGTGPSGLVVRVAPDGNARVIYDSPETYVWSLAVDARGTHVYAGTGPKGRIYQITPRGQATIFYTTKQEHILSLATGPGGLLYAGTDKDGLVYRIDPKGKGFVLYNAPQAEVRSLLVTPDGVYAGTSSPVRRRSGGSSAAGGGERSAVSEGVRALPASASKHEGEENKAKRTARFASSSASSAEEGKKSDSAASVSPPAAGENSLYRIQPDGTVREIFREKALLLSLLRRQGRLFVGTGMEGQLFEIDEATRERSEIARLDHGQIHCLCQRRDGSIIVGTGDPGRLYVLHDQYAAQGTVVSDVLDAKILSKWGALRWRADTPPGTRVTVAVRSGNIAEPDETWSDWSAEQTDARQATIPAPPARFLQYRVTLATDSPAVTPALHSLALRYRTTNQAPEVSKLEVPDFDAVNLENPKKLKFKWAATDANEDELTYRLYVRKEGWKSWVLLEDDLDKKEYEWDTTTTPSGVYRLRLVASDRHDNPAEEALTGERVSDPFVVAHEPPAVAVKVAGVEGDRAVIEATAHDPLVRLTAAAFAVNGRSGSTSSRPTACSTAKRRRSASRRGRSGRGLTCWCCGSATRPATPARGTWCLR